MQLSHIILDISTLRHVKNADGSTSTICTVKEIDLLSEDASILKEWLSQFASITLVSLTFVFANGSEQVFIDGKLPPLPCDPNRSGGDWAEAIPLTEGMREIYGGDAIVSARSKIIRMKTPRKVSSKPEGQ